MSHDTLGDMGSVLEQRGGWWTMRLSPGGYEVLYRCGLNVEVSAVRPDPEAAVVAVLCQLSLEESA